MVADGSLRQVELSRQLLRRPGALAEKARYLRAQRVRERTQLLGLGDEERLGGLVVESRGLGDYGRDTPNIREIPTIRNSRLGSAAVEPLRVEVRRGGTVEARHLVHAVAVRSGEIVAQAGDPRVTAFLRSSSKPIQAVPLARARPDVDERDLAIACASHRAEPAQIEAVRRLLAKAPARERELECGVQEGRTPEPLYHNCSGKHAGMLALCRAHDWRSEGYRHEGHRVQRAMLAVHAEAAEVDADSVVTAIDGCGVITFALTLERMGHAFARLRALRGGGRVVEAMQANPELVGGAGQTDTELMLALPGWIAKGGAEGLMCAAAPDGTGIALKVEDSASRAHRPALHVFLARLGAELSAEFERVPVTNAHGEIVGEIVCDS
jgi:L-asparaginase II